MNFFLGLLLTPVPTNKSVRAVLVVAYLFAHGAWAIESAKVSGVVFTAGPGQIKTVWPNARVTLKSLAARNEVSTVSNHLGEYIFTGILPGEHEVRVTLAGFETVAKQISLEEGGAVQVDFQLVPGKQSQTIEVTAETKGVDLTSSSGGTPALTAGLLKSAIRLSEDFQEVLPLLPGVVRGPDGLLRIKGGRTNQTNALVNTASAADPFTGQPALRLPTVAVQSIRVLSNPFSAEAVNPAPRFGFVFAPARDNRTAIRGGFGVFFDKIPLNVAVFPDFPLQTITRFASDGVSIADGPKAFPHVVATNDGRQIFFKLSYLFRF